MHGLLLGWKEKANNVVEKREKAFKWFNFEGLLINNGALQDRPLFCNSDGSSNIPKIRLLLFFSFWKILVIGVSVMDWRKVEQQYFYLCFLLIFCLI